MADGLFDFEAHLAARLDPETRGFRLLGERRHMVSDDLEAIRAAAAAEEREQRAEREQRRLERELDRPPPEPDWSRFTSTLQMDARTFSLWCDLSPRPKLGPPEPPAPPLRPPAPAIDKLKMAGQIARGVARAMADETKADRERIATLELRLRRLEEGLIQKALTSSEPSCRSPAGVHVGQPPWHRSLTRPPASPTSAGSKPRARTGSPRSMPASRRCSYAPRATPKSGPCIAASRRATPRLAL